MRTRRRIVSIFLVMTMVLSMFTGTVFAGNPTYREGETEEFSWLLDDQGKLYIIPKPGQNTLSLYEFDQDIYDNTSELFIDLRQLGQGYGVYIQGSNKFEQMSVEICDTWEEGDPMRNLTIENLPSAWDLYLPDEPFTDITLKNVGIIAFIPGVEVSFLRFESCANLEYVMLPEGLFRLSMTDCPVAELNVPEGVSGITLDHMYALEALNLPDEIDWVGISDSSLESFIVKSGYEEVNLAFNDNLLTADIEEGRTCIDDHMFYKCTSLIDVIIPNGVTSIEYGAFALCTSLDYLGIPSSVKSISHFAFQSDGKLEDLDLPDGLERIGDCAFMYSGLTSIDIPDGITKIEYSTFEHCENLQTVTIPSNVESIAASAFFGDGRIKNVYFEGSRAQFENIIISHKDDPRFDNDEKAYFGAMENAYDLFPASTTFHFAKESNRIYLDSNDCGSVMTTVTVADEGDEVKLILVPDPGYMVGNILVYDSNETVIPVDYDDYSFIMPETEAYVEVTFVPVEYSIQITGAYTGYIESLSPTSAQPGDVVGLNIVPILGYKLTDVEIIDGEGAGVPYVNGKFIMPDSDVFVLVFLEKITNDWCKDAEGNWYYFDENGDTVQSWYQIGGKWYFFNGDGIMQKGWLEDGSKWYYLKADGTLAKGWQKITGKWYYFDGSGVMATGWKKIDGVYYYFAASGKMMTGWQEIDGTWYYFNSDGSMRKGWLLERGSYYYFDGSGAMVTGWKKVSGVYYFFAENGKMATGWLEYNGKIYYLKDSGAMACSETINIGGVDYTFNSSGACTNPPVN